MYHYLLFCSTRPTYKTTTGLVHSHKKFWTLLKYAQWVDVKDVMYDFLGSKCVTEDRVQWQELDATLSCVLGSAKCKELLLRDCCMKHVLYRPRWYPDLRREAEILEWEQHSEEKGVGIAPSVMWQIYRLSDQAIVASLLAWARDFSLLWSVQIGSGSHLPSYPVCTWGYFSWMKGQVVMLITQLHLVLQIRVCGAKDALSHMTKHRSHEQQ